MAKGDRASNATGRRKSGCALVRWHIAWLNDRVVDLSPVAYRSSGLSGYSWIQ